MFFFVYFFVLKWPKNNYCFRIVCALLVVTIFLSGLQFLQKLISSFFVLFRVQACETLVSNVGNFWSQLPDSHPLSRPFLAALFHGFERPVKVVAHLFPAAYSTIVKARNCTDAIAKFKEFKSLPSVIRKRKAPTLQIEVCKISFLFFSFFFASTFLVDFFFCVSFFALNFLLQGMLATFKAILAESSIWWFVKSGGSALCCKVSFFLLFYFRLLLFCRRLCTDTFFLLQLYRKNFTDKITERLVKLGVRTFVLFISTFVKERIFFGNNGELYLRKNE